MPQGITNSYCLIVFVLSLLNFGNMGEEHSGSCQYCSTAVLQCFIQNCQKSDFNCFKESETQKTPQNAYIWDLLTF